MALLQKEPAGEASLFQNQYHVQQQGKQEDEEEREYESAGSFFLKDIHRCTSFHR